ncbi:unnamed protein product [Owenia fusiformis]|uniref:Uncharacterized protein n=1 Tax=Owenia fusiformis TaxID=6347 RepID=A0A8J1Y385_OWEFU|nr:unnamed protein product [Owenia fusiformis]
MDALIGKWQQVGSVENIDGLLDAADAPQEIRHVAKNIKGDVEYSKNGDAWHFCAQFGTFKSDKDFKLNEEFDHMGVGGIPVKSTVRFEDGRFVESHVAASKGWVAKHTKTITGDTMTIEMELKGVKAVQHMKRV